MNSQIIKKNQSTIRWSKNTAIRKVKGSEISVNENNILTRKVQTIEHTSGLVKGKECNAHRLVWIIQIDVVRVIELMWDYS